MGKIRLKTLGDDELEQQQSADAQKRRDIKKQKKGEGTSEVEVMEQVRVSEGQESKDAAVVSEKAPAVDKKSGKKPGKKGSASDRKTTKIGKKLLDARKKVDSSKKYSVIDAIKLIKSVKYAKFDETLELHAKLKEPGLKGQVTLPHGTGKELRVAIADEKLLKDIEAGNLNFDILVTSPAFMPKLVQFARVLGPKGLMPNPKNGTVSENPEEAAKKFKGGNINFKSEAKAPLLHQAVGKLSFTDENLAENVTILLAAIGNKNIVSAYLSGTMTPSVNIEVA